MDEQKVINEAVDKLEQLNGESFHGYRSEVYRVIAETVKKIREEKEGFHP